MPLLLPRSSLPPPASSPSSGGRGRCRPLKLVATAATLEAEGAAELHLPPRCVWALRAPTPPPAREPPATPPRCVWGCELCRRLLRGSREQRQRRRTCWSIEQRCRGTCGGRDLLRGRTGEACELRRHQLTASARDAQGRQGGSGGAGDHPVRARRRGSVAHGALNRSMVAGHRNLRRWPPTSSASNSLSYLRGSPPVPSQGATVRPCARAAAAQGGAALARR